ncbi:RNA polymerase II associated protein 2 [Mortierella sp. NVP85]|nr:RNA polymerase II associated protein 2 [Mortierella sp. NVP85]
MATGRAPTMKDDIVVDRSPLIAQYLPQELRGSSSNRQPKGHAGGTPKPNRKQAVLQHNLELRKKFESMVLQWQEILCDPVDEQTLGEAANRIKQSHYQEVVEERNIGNLCGYPLCSEPPRNIKGRFRISLQERKVYDITVLKKYCSSTCLSASRWFEAQLTEEPIYLNNTDPEHLKTVRVSIVPLKMELTEFQAQMAKDVPSEDGKAAQAYTLPERDLEADPTSIPKATSSTPEATSSLGNEYVQSLLSSVPKAPSFVKIVEHDTTSVIPREPSDAESMERDMENESNGYGDDSDDNDHHQHDAVDGYRVPVNRRKSEVDRIESKLSNISLSDPKDQHPPQDHSIRRSGSSTSMDIQP